MAIMDNWELILGNWYKNPRYARMV